MISASSWADIIAALCPPAFAGTLPSNREPKVVFAHWHKPAPLFELAQPFGALFYI
jgi:hypothetical protein